MNADRSLNFENCCRTCLNSRSYQMCNIFAEIGHSLNIADIINKNTALNINKQDSLSKKICNTCFICIKSFYEFCELAKAVDSTLRQQNKNGSNTDNIKCTGRMDNGSDSIKMEKDVDDIIESDNNNDNNLIDMDIKNEFYQHEHEIDSSNRNNNIDSIEVLLDNNSELLSYKLKCEGGKKKFRNLSEIKHYTCDVCLKTYTDCDKFVKHLNRHQPVDIKQRLSEGKECEDCSLIFQSKNALSAHMRKHVEKDRILSCSICGRVFTKISHLKRHELSHKVKHKVNCSLCPTTLVLDANNRQDHVDIEKSDMKNMQNPEQKCEVCYLKFQSKSGLSAHMRKHDKKNRILSCSICGKVFAKTSHLKQHEFMHKDYTDQEKTDMKNTQSSLEKCEVCLLVFQSKNALSAHMRKHAKKGRVLSCTVCGKVFAKTSHLKRHELSHEVNHSFKCSICPKTFALETSLNEHFNKHNGIKPHSCPMCSKSFAHLTTLTTHIRIHLREKPYLCPTCGKRFDSSTNLNQHIKRHQGLKLFACMLCPRKFVSKGELKSHNITHTGEKSFACEQCGATFTARTSLAKHTMRHLGVKPHQCDTCPMKFTCKDHLKRHYRIHTGEKPYKCDMCERAFTQSNDLVKHRRAHLGNNLYKCSQCTQSFRLKTELRQHISEHFVSQQLELSEAAAPADVGNEPEGCPVDVAHNNVQSVAETK